MALDPRSRGLAQTAGYAGTDADIDAGLRKYMLSVYNYMALGVAFTGIIAMAVALNPAIMQAVALRSDEMGSVHRCAWSRLVLRQDYV